MAGRTLFVCLHCGTLNRAGARFCTRCAQSLTNAPQLSNENLLELYRQHRHEIDTLSNPHLLFILSFVEHIGKTTLRELAHDLGLETGELQSRLAPLLRSRMLVDHGGALAVSPSGKTFLAQTGFSAPTIAPPSPPQPPTPRAHAPAGGAPWAKWFAVAVWALAIAVASVGGLIYYFWQNPPATIPTPVPPVPSATPSVTQVAPTYTPAVIPSATHTPTLTQTWTPTRARAFTPTRTPTSTPTPDKQGPSITNVYSTQPQIWYGDSVCGPHETTIRATVTDPSGVNQVWLAYHVRDGATVTAWQFVVMSNSGGNTYQRAITTPPVSPTSSNKIVEFYVYAFDARGNRAESPRYTIAIAYCLAHLGSDDFVL